MMRAIAGSRLIDGTQASPKEDAVLVIRDDVVEAVVRREELAGRYPEVTGLTEYSGCTVMPGLVNCHSHLTMPGDGTPVEQAMARSDDALLVTATRNARRALDAGVTTLADLAGRDFITFRFREALAHANIDAPRLRLAGHPITAKLGHCWPMHYGVDDMETLRETIRRLLARGADLLKVMVTGGSTIGSDSFSVALPQELLNTVVEEAARAGKPSFAHVQCISAIRAAIKAGFDVIVHGTFFDSEGNLGFDEEVVELARAHRVTWNPTLNVNWSNLKRLEAKDTPQDYLNEKERQYRLHDTYLLRVYEAGIPIAAGSDEGWSHNRYGTFAEELAVLVGTGMKPIDVIRSATAISARALGVDDRVGTFEKGKYADVIVVDGDPLADITTLSRVRDVYMGGRRIERNPLPASGH